MDEFARSYAVGIFSLTSVARIIPRITRQSNESGISLAAHGRHSINGLRDPSIVAFPN